MKVYVTWLCVCNVAARSLFDDKIIGVFDSEEAAKQVQHDMDRYVDPFIGECAVLYEEWDTNDTSKVEFWKKRDARYIKE
jgi:hypothetical protein